MIDLSVEQPIPLTDVCRLIPPGRGGRRTHLSTLLRWIRKGAKAPDGTTLRLEAIRLGGRWMTSRAALQRFAEALTPRPGPEAAPAVLVRTAAQRQRASDKAAAELEKMGI
jgi:hypothetical protein